MSSLPHPRPPVHPLERLSLWLAGEGYHQAAIARLLIYAHREGTPTGAPDLDREDEEYAEHAYVEGQEPIQDGMGDNRAWLDPGVYNSVGADYTLDRLGWSLERMQDALADTDEMPLPPIGGGVE
jgi:hypothetical protein